MTKSIGDVFREACELVTRGNRPPERPWSPARSSHWLYNQAPREGGPEGIASTTFRDLKDDKGMPIYTLPEGWVWDDDPIALAEFRRLGIQL